MIFPGGFGAAKNLSNFATSPDLEVEPETERVIREFHAAGKPIGLCCIAPILVAAVLGEKGVKITLGKKGEGWPYSTTEGQGQDAIDKAKALGCQVGIVVDKLGTDLNVSWHDLCNVFSSVMK